METSTTSQPRFADYIRPLIARWWLILIAVVVATGGVYAYYARQRNVYTASTSVYYHDPGDPVTGVPSLQSTDRNVADEASLLYSRETAASVARKIHYPGTAEALLSQVSITSKAGQDFVQVTAQAGSPVQAARIANTFAQQLVLSLDGAVSLRIASALKLSQNQLSQVARGPATVAQRANLQDQINRLELALNVPTTVARQVDAASPPSSLSAPKPVRNALFAFILSLVAALGVAYGLERFDRRLKNPDEMETAYKTPLLGVLPRSTSPTPTNEGEPVLGSDFREPFRVLRMNIELAAVDSPPSTLVVSSAIPGEGKSTVVRNLALAIRETGRRVAVVDLDLRHPALGQLFGVISDRGPGVPPRPGVTEVLRHQVELESALLHVGVGLPAFEEFLVGGPTPTSSQNGPAQNGAPGNGVVKHGSDIALLLSGARPANPPAVLSSERLVQVLDELRERHDVVLIDSAPVLAVADTVPLLRYADAALFVSRFDVTTRDTAKRLMEFLARVPDANLLGIVANDLSRMEAGSYGYGYGYAYGEERHGLRGRRKAAAAEGARQTV
jgi:non-specific protein-tyrosine kinase